MARIRSIKPEFWTDGLIVKLPMEARLFYIGLWNFADDYGVLEDDPDSLKLRILPADDVDVSELVALLVENGRLRRGIAPDGAAVLVIVAWLAHQKIDKRAAGRHGVPDEFTYADSPPIPTNPADSPPTPPESHHSPGFTSSEGKGPRDGAVYTREWETWWSGWPKKTDKAQAHKTYLARRRHGTTAEQLIEARDAYLERADPEFVKYGGTFLSGTEGSWSEYLNLDPADPAEPATIDFDPEPARPNGKRCEACATNDGWLVNDQGHALRVCDHRVLA